MLTYVENLGKNSPTLRADKIYNTIPKVTSQPSKPRTCRTKCKGDTVSTYRSSSKDSPFFASAVVSLNRIIPPRSRLDRPTRLRAFLLSTRVDRSLNEVEGCLLAVSVKSRQVGLIQPLKDISVREWHTTIDGLFCSKDMEDYYYVNWRVVVWGDILLLVS